jgi:hypothetical protein
LEPLQEQVEQMITSLETEKSIMEQAHAESREVLKENMIAQNVDILAEKSAQKKDKVSPLVSITTIHISYDAMHTTPF